MATNVAITTIFFIKSAYKNTTTKVAIKFVMGKRTKKVGSAAAIFGEVGGFETRPYG
jgi:hypothetical protein